MSQMGTWSQGQVVLALHDFQERSRENLPFRKGEILTILNSTQDPNWYIARNSSGHKGMIPANYVRKHALYPQNQGTSGNFRVSPSAFPATSSHHSYNNVTLQQQEIHTQSMPWFHGKISREEAADLLYPRRVGLFLVRESGNYPGDYTLCVAIENKVENYHIKFQNNMFTIDDDNYFETLVKLVEHYERDADGLCSQLLYPLPKQGAHDVAVNIGQFAESGWAIRKEDLRLGEMLGDGEFGAVYKGVYKGRQVAAKQLKETTAKAVQAFLKEASVMTSLDHPNLVKLIGVVVSPTQIILVTEFMGIGSLVEFLRSRGRSVITKKQLIDFSCDTCNGMEYLEHRNLVHRDLAARNVLLNDQEKAKISDFGLALQDDNFSSGVKFPIKWTAPEALKGSKFTSKSDMWSFGILLWEIYSFGRVPYPRIPLSDAVMHVEKGYRMEAPEGCPKEIYDIMMRAWKAKPEERPTFKAVNAELSQIRDAMEKNNVMIKT